LPDLAAIPINAMDTAMIAAADNEATLHACATAGRITSSISRYRPVV
jgi:hypothetical protein